MRTLALALLLQTPVEAVRQGPEVSITPVWLLPTTVGARLTYEVHATNFTAAPLTVEALEISYDGESWAIDGDALAGALQLVGTGRPGPLPPGGRAVIFIDLPVQGAPRELAHRLVVSAGGTRWAIPLGSVPVRADLAVLGPPLKGGPWVALRAPGLERGHRRVIHALGGRATIPGRFAMDFERLDETGRMAAAGEDDPTRFLGYDAPVLAVADGMVVAVRSDVPDPPRIAGRPRASLADEAGNSVVLDIGGGRFAVYEHLRRRIPVRVGQRVRRGEVIGALGFTGSASEPHLHFHLAAGPNVLGSEGIPYAFDSFELIGGYLTIADALAGQPWKPPIGTPGPTAGRYPDINAVVRFP